MLGVYRFIAVVLSVWLALSSVQVPLLAKTRKGEKLLKEGEKAENMKDWDKALSLYEQALATDFGDPAYQLRVRKIRFQAAQSHIEIGLKLRRQGKLEEALSEFQKAFAIDPSSSLAETEAKRTYQMIQRNKGETGAALTEEDRGLTPAQVATREMEEKIASMRSVPDLKPLNPQISNLKMTNQNARVLFETVAKLAGINVLFDADFLSSLQGKNFSLDIMNSTIEESLDYLSLTTKAFWKPITANAIFVTQDQRQKRAEYEDSVVKVFYLQNVTAAQELNEIAAAVRGVTNISKLLTYGAQMAIMARGTADQISLAQKLIYDLDKPKSEVVIDIIVMEANRSKTRNLAATIASGGKPGINIPISFTGGTSTGEEGGTGGSATLGNLGSLSANDFSLAMPGALVQALLNENTTRVLQNPQIRTLDNVKGTLKIGDRYPYATGSFQAGVATTVSPLVSTQFQFAEVGVNVDVLPKIHGNNDVSLHVEVEISNIRSRINVGGLEQPVIGQRKLFEDVRLREGEVSVMGGLSSLSDSRTTAGLPWLANIPGIGFLFGSKGLDTSNSELLLVMVPRIVRGQDISDVNMRGVSSGNEQTIKLNYSPRATPPVADPAAPQAPQQTAPQADIPKAAVPPVNQATLQLIPGMPKASVGTPITVSLEVNGAKDLFNAPLRLNYDPKLLKLTEIARGNLMSSDNQPVSFTRDVNTGTVKLARLPGTSGVSGDGTLVTFTFQPLTKGTATVSVEDAFLLDSKLLSLNPVLKPLTLTIE